MGKGTAVCGQMNNYERIYCSEGIIMTTTFTMANHPLTFSEHDLIGKPITIGFDHNRTVGVVESARWEGGVLLFEADIDSEFDLAGIMHGSAALKMDEEKCELMSIGLTLQPAPSKMTPAERRRQCRKMKPWARSVEYARRRCTDRDYHAWKFYGGRGIKCTLTTEQAHELFIRDQGHLLQKPSLDRIDPDGDYTFENCRYIELAENRRRSRVSGSINYNKGR